MQHIIQELEQEQHIVLVIRLLVGLEVIGSLQITQESLDFDPFYDDDELHLQDLFHVLVLHVQHQLLFQPPHIQDRLMYHKEFPYL